MIFSILSHILNKNHFSDNNFAPSFPDNFCDKNPHICANFKYIIYGKLRFSSFLGDQKF